MSEFSIGKIATGIVDGWGSKTKADDYDKQNIGANLGNILANWSHYNNNNVIGGAETAAQGAFGWGDKF